MDDVRLERILRAVECVPAGRAATYGLIGRVVGESPRVVGNVLGRWGSTVPWWRVVNASGTIPGHEAAAREHWEAEDLLSPGGTRVDLARVLAEEAVLRAAWLERVAGLDG